MSSTIQKTGKGISPIFSDQVTCARYPLARMMTTVNSTIFVEDDVQGISINDCTSESGMHSYISTDHVIHEMSSIY